MKPFIYGVLEDRLYHALNQSEPDFVKANELLLSGADINASSVSDLKADMLSSLISEYWTCTEPIDFRTMTDDSIFSQEDFPDEQDRISEENFIKIISFFLTHGFDVKKNNGLWGFHALRALPASNFISSVTDAAKLLLSAGASDFPQESDNVIQSIISEQYMLSTLGDYYSFSMLEAFYRMVTAAANHTDYQSIDTFEHIIGDTITSIYVKPSDSDSPPFAADTNKCNGTYHTQLYIVCKNRTLIITSYAASWTETISSYDNLIPASQHFSELIGKQILDIEYLCGGDTQDESAPAPELYIFIKDHITLKITSDPASWEKDSCAFAVFIIE